MTGWLSFLVLSCVVDLELEFVLRDFGVFFVIVESFGVILVSFWSFWAHFRSPRFTRAPMKFAGCLQDVKID